jgi:hypothetical protein
MLQWFERGGYGADIAGLEGEFARALTKLPDWARRLFACFGELPKARRFRCAF